MELTAPLLSFVLLLLFVIAVLFGKLLKKPHSLLTEAGKLPIVDNASTCENCTHFSLEGGQSLLHANPAFAAASQVLAPWQMSQPREVEPNPDYDVLEARMQAAGSAGDHELEHRLHNELLDIRPGTLKEPESYLDRDMLRTQWTDFGACGRHSELRTKTDSCDEYRSAK